MVTETFVLVKKEVSKDFYQYFGLDPIGIRIINNLNEDMENTSSKLAYFSWKEYLIGWITCRGWLTFSVKGQIANILGFLGHEFSVANT